MKLNIDPRYRFSQSDYDRCLEIENAKIFCAYEQMKPLTPEEEEFTKIMNFVWRHQSETGRWLTYGEYLHMEKEMYERLSTMADAKEAAFYAKHGKPKAA